MSMGWGGRVHTVRRSMSAELDEGATDGRVKKIVRDRGGITEGTTAQARSDLTQQYGICEDSSPVLPVPPFQKMRAG
jgi:hypothetical protein